MNYTLEQYQASAQAIREKLGGFVPKVAMVLGSGLGYLGDEVEQPVCSIHRARPQGPHGLWGARGPEGGRYAGADAPL